MNFFLYKKNFALDGQTRWAKSFLQPVNLPSAQPLMKSMQFKCVDEQMYHGQSCDRGSLIDMMFCVRKGIFVLTDVCYISGLRAILLILLQMSRKM